MKLDNSWLMLVALVGTFAIVGWMLDHPVPDKNAQLVLAIVMFPLGFFFGSSINKNRSPDTIQQTTTTTTGDVLDPSLVALNQAAKDAAAVLKGDS